MSKSIHLREALLSAGHFGDPAAPLAALLATAFNNFKMWRRYQKIPCSQKQFRPRQLVKEHHGYYFTAKAYNSRIILMWLAEKCNEASMNDPGDLKLRLHASALTLDCILQTMAIPVFTNDGYTGSIYVNVIPKLQHPRNAFSTWFALTESAGRYLHHGLHHICSFAHATKCIRTCTSTSN